MGIGVLISMMVVALTDGIYSQMRDIVVTRTLGHVQIHHEDYPGRRGMYDVVDDAAALVSELEALPSTRAVATRMYGNALLGGKDQTTGAQLIGVEPEREASIRQMDDKVVEGSFLPDVPEGGVLLGVDLAEKLEVGIGDSVVAVTQAADGSLGNELYEVQGFVRLGVPMLDRSTAFLHIDDLATLLTLDGAVHELTVLGETDDDASIGVLAGEVKGAVGERALMVRTWDEVDPATASMFGLQTISNVISVMFFFSVAAAGVVNTLLMSVFERTRELGMMRALGVRPRELVILVIFESLFIALIATAGGVFFGLLGDLWLVTQGLDLSVDGQGISNGTMTFDPVVYGKISVASIVLPVAGVLFCSIAASIWPAWRASRLEPVEAMREG